MGSKTFFVVLLVVLVGGPTLASASLSKDLKEELQGYADTHKKAEDAEAKQAALMTLGRIGDSAAKKTLAEFKSAEDKRVKLAANMGLWLAGDRRADNALVDQLTGDAQLYLTLRDVISGLPDDKEASLVKQLVKKADDAKKRDVFRYLAQQHGDLYALLGDYLVNRDDKERAGAVEATLFTARDQAADFAQKMIDSRRKQIRASGVKLAMGLSGRPGGMDKAITVLEDALEETSGDVADGVARYLTTLGNDKGSAYLVEKLGKLGKLKEDKKDKKDKEKHEELQEIAEFLLEHRVTVSAEVAKPLMESKNDAIKALGFQLAATSADDAFVGKLHEMFASTIFDKRVIAVKALGYTGSDQAVGLLGRALFEGNKDLRLYGAKGLGRIGHKNGLRFLEKALGGERDPAVKLAVVEAVSRIDEAKSLQLLRFQTTQRDPKIKLAVVQGIRRLGQADGVKALTVVQQDRNLDIKWQAFLTTLELAPEQGLALMSSALRNPPTGFMADIEQLDADTRTKVIKHLLVHGDDASRAAAMSTARRSGESMFGMYRELVTESDTPDNVRRMALSALAEKRDDKDKSLFEKLVKSDSKATRRLAAWTLTAYASKDLEATFRGMLGHDDPAIKSIAAYGLAAVND
jgi:HEAT repeat protein